MKSALSQEFVRPNGLREKINRPQVGLCLLLLSVMFGSLMLSEVRTKDFVPWIIGGVAIVCAGAGALYHPINRFWMKGAVSGLVAGLGALVVTYYYLEWRFRLTGSIWSFEFVLSSLAGALPGIGLYGLLMRHEVVDERDVAQTN